MDSCKRPETMERITTPELAEAFIAQQVEAIMSRSPGEQAGIGIRNVDDRLKIYFGPRYGLRITSEPDVGTCVEIRMPKVRGEDGYEAK